MSDLTLTEDVDEGINPTRQRPLCARCEKIDYKRNGERAAKHLPGDVLPVEAIRFVVDFIEEGALVLEDGRLQLNPRITSLRHRQIKSGNGA